MQKREGRKGFIPQHIQIIRKSAQINPGSRKKPGFYRRDWEAFHDIKTKDGIRRQHVLRIGYARTL